MWSDRSFPVSLCPRQAEQRNLSLRDADEPTEVGGTQEEEEFTLKSTGRTVYGQRTCRSSQRSTIG